MRYLDRNDDFESFLASLNAAAQGMTPPELRATPPGSAQIVGLPRSGTTLLYQLLARTGAVGYPSNVMALFHRAPWVGARIQAQLAVNEATLSLESVGGRTPEPLDPHEFGYFWRRVCGHSSNSLVRDLTPLPMADLQHELDLVAAVFGRPVVYKNYLALAHAREMRTGLRDMRFVVVERSRVDVAASLLRLRRKIGLGDDEHLGVRPRSDGASYRSAEHLVAGQVVRLEKGLRRLTSTQVHDTLVVSYDDLCADPRSVVRSVLEHVGAEADNVNHVPDRLESGGGSRALSDAEQHQLQALLEEADERGDDDG